MKNDLLTPEAINYCWQQLALRVGIDTPSDGSVTSFEVVGIPVYYGEFNDKAPQIDKGIIVLPARPESWKNLLLCEADSIKWVAIEKLLPFDTTLDIKDSIPVIFQSGDDAKPFIFKSNNNVVIFNIDIIALTFFMLTRWEETQKDVGDHYSRFPASESVAYKLGFLNHPIVDEYAQILRSWILNIFPEVELNIKPFQVKLSHDIDYVKKHSGFFKIIRYSAKNIFLKSGISEIGKALKSYISYKEDPYYQGIIKLAELSEEHKLKSAFYFMTASPSKFDNGYWMNSSIPIKVINELLLRGHEIGLHPGHTTFLNLKLLSEQKKRLYEILGCEGIGGRQHNLRFKIPDTWEDWERAGLLYDSTAGYADVSGFRCGTCYRYHPFNIKLNREMSIWEEPLIVMDVTLKRYNHLTPSDAKIIIVDLAKRCKAVGGVFTLLWHNSSLDGEWLEWGDVYAEVLTELTILQNH